jgi:riboflavin kinase
MTITTTAESLPASTSPTAPSAATPKSYEMAPVDRASRPMIVGPAAPEPPYPLKMVGRVTKGFGRGSKELGIPTANLPDDAIGGLVNLGWTGVYYGFARVYPDIKEGEMSEEDHHEEDDKSDFLQLSSTSLAQLPQHTAAYPPSSTVSSAMPSRTASPAPTLPTLSEAAESLLPSRKHKKRKMQKEDYQVWPMVMSVGWNPYYKNEKLTAVSGASVLVV